MKWENLKQNKCPKCNKSWLTLWQATFKDKMIFCKCGFSISEKRMAEIVTDKVSKEILESECA